ncbi:signal transduction histidine kinase [Nocardia caishijiensis]|uniref:histidine kinase n=3 Tax=Nocardia caishijiensis TaxID=184756 RepID=A0ABQ6YGJ3_9NOCA|nr:signal transduction histidine kinase [Nocardia caishijiensis]
MPNRVSLSETRAATLQQFRYVMAMFLARLGVRTRILAIALIPSLTLVVVGVGTAGYLVEESNKAKTWASEMQAAVPYTRALIEAVQSERQLTLAYLAGDDTAAEALGPARTRLDAAFQGLIEISTDIRAVDDSEIGDDKGGFNTLGTHLTGVRQGADARMLPANDAYTFYSRLLDVLTQGTKVAERAAPDAVVASGVAEGVRILHAAEAMSRSNAISLSLVTADGPTGIPIEELVNQIGYYHTELATIVTELDEDERGPITAMMSSPHFAQLAAMESAIVSRFAAPQQPSTSSTRTQTVAALPMSIPEWHTAAAEVNRAMVEAYGAHNSHIQKLAEQTAQRAQVNAALAGGGVVVVSLLAFLIAVILANRIIRRLRRLRTETLALADEQLPATMRTLRDGGDVEPADIAPKLDFGRDEIGQVADAFEHAAAAALRAAVDEARTREGVRAVFLNIAHRSQIVVHRQLEILDEAERSQEDPALLETLFRLDHLATRERRNAENLIILGGGRPGRQWRNPIPLMDIVRSAIGETLDYARVRVTKLPEVDVVGTVVADLVHLLAELVDNATAFSPPQSRVEAGGNIVGKGVVVEITDQGMGMSPEDLARYNDMLADPPDFGVGTLSSDSRLGLFVVARLSTAHGVSVRLSESDYGGIRAIVLIPQNLLAGAAAMPSSPATTGPLRRGLPRPHEQAPAAALEQAPVATLVAEPPAPRPAEPIVDTRVVEAEAAPQPETGPDGRPLLPRRQRQTNLRPELTEEPTTAEPTAPAPRPRSAEQARDLMSAIEIGTRQGRKPLSNSHQDEQEG